MRTLEECQAEVFRRSEKRIKERKRRNRRTLAVCVPLALLLCVMAVYPFPQKQPSEWESAFYSGQTESVDGEVISCQETVADDPASVGSEPVTVVEDTDEDGVIWLREAADVRKLLDILEAAGNGGDQQSVSASTSSTQPRQYTIRVSQDDGTWAEFTLCGQTLTAQGTGEVYYLDAAGYEALLEVMGLN